MPSTSTDRLTGLTTSVAVKAPCVAAAAANITLSGLQTIDGVTLAEDDRVLVKGQTDTTENGVYNASSGTWARTADCDGTLDMRNGTLVYVTGGSTYSGVYKAVAATADITPGTTAVTFTLVSVTDVLTQLASTASAVTGAGLVGYHAQRAYAAGTVGASLRNTRWVTDNTSTGAGVTMGSVAAGVRTTNTTAFNQHMADLAALGGGELLIPAGSIEHDGTLNPPDTSTACVNVRGAGMFRTSLKYYGATLAVNMAGAGTNNRIICTWSDLGLIGTNATNDARGVSIGWNTRAQPLLNRVYIYDFPHNGLYFSGYNWLMTMRDVNIDHCGHTTNNSSGIGKDASVDSGNLNDIVLDNFIVEGCGNASSTAGGVDFRSTSIGNRGVYWINPCFENNAGADEMYFTNLHDLQFYNPYMEREDVAGRDIGLELSGCDGAIHGGYITSSGASNLYGLRIVNGSDFSLHGTNTGSWTTNPIYCAGATLRTYGAMTMQSGSAGPLLPAHLTLSGNYQLYGDLAPRVSAHKNGSNQTVGSGAATKVTFGTEVYDSLGTFSGSTFTPIAISGYRVEACVTWAAALDNDPLVLYIYLNGAAYKQVTLPAGGTGEQSVTIAAEVHTTAVTDTIEIYAKQTSLGNKDIDGTATKTWLMISQIGRVA